MPQSMPVSEALAAKINSVCVDALDKGIQDGMAAKGDEIVRDLMGESMASKRPVWIHAVAFHPENRFGAGLEPVDAWSLLKTHAPRGWSWNAVEGQARAAEIPIGAAGDRIRSRNREVAEASAGLLPPVREEDLLVCAFTKTHTSATLRIVDREGKPPDGDDPFWNGLLKEDGCLSKEKFLDRFPSYADPVKKGIEWVVIKSEVFNACPRLPAFLQEAGNLDHNVTSKETTLQLCFEANRKQRDDPRSGSPGAREVPPGSERQVRPPMYVRGHVGRGAGRAVLETGRRFQEHALCPARRRSATAGLFSHF